MLEVVPKSSSSPFYSVFRFFMGSLLLLLLLLLFFYAPCINPLKLQPCPTEKPTLTSPDPRRLHPDSHPTGPSSLAKTHHRLTPQNRSELLNLPRSLHVILLLSCRNPHLYQPATDLARLSVLHHPHLYHPATIFAGLQLQSLLLRLQPHRHRATNLAKLSRVMNLTCLRPVRRHSHAPLIGEAVLMARSEYPTRGEPNHSRG